MSNNIYASESKNNLADYWEDEPFEPTFDDVFWCVSDDDEETQDNLSPARISEAEHTLFWMYYDRFIRYSPRKTHNIKSSYATGFIQRNYKHGKKAGKPIPLFDKLAVELTERHLDVANWADWKGETRFTDAIWLALQMPRRTTYDIIDPDAKNFKIGSYHEDGDKTKRLIPVVSLPLSHFIRLKKIYDTFPGRVWCISSETLGIHAIKKHQYPQLSEELHKANKLRLASIGEGDTEAHPMPGRCLRRPFGDGYWTITDKGSLTSWQSQIRYFEEDGRTPPFKTIVIELFNRMIENLRKWQMFGRKKPSQTIEELKAEHQKIREWVKSGCPITETSPPPPEVKTDHEVPEEVPPSERIIRAVFDFSCGEKSEQEVGTILDEARRDEHKTVKRTLKAKKFSQSGLRGGNWAKELQKLARHGLQEDDSVGTVVFEMAKWLWWIELYDLPEHERLNRVTGLLKDFVSRKHNGFVSRLATDEKDEVVGQIQRCVEAARRIERKSSLKGFALTREKRKSGSYKNIIMVADAITDREEIISSSSRQFTFMCTRFDSPLPDSLQQQIKSFAGRNRILPFTTRLFNRLYSKEGRDYVGRQTLIKLLGYKSPSQISRYLKILSASGLIKMGTSYKVGRNGKLFELSVQVMEVMSSSNVKVDGT